MKLGLRLYVTSASSFSRAAQDAVRKLQEDYPQISFEIEVVDVVESPALAEADEITATPTLLKLSPPPMKRIVCDFSDLSGELDLRKEEDSSQAHSRDTFGSIGKRK